MLKFYHFVSFFCHTQSIIFPSILVGFYVNYYSNIRTPGIITIYKTDKHKQVRILQDNTFLKTKIQRYTIPEKEFFKFTTSEGIELNGYIIKPVDFDQFISVIKSINDFWFSIVKLPKHSD